MAEEKQGVEEKEEGLINPLRGREVRPDHNWYELMQLWESAKTVGEMESILHRGYRVTMSRYDREEKEYTEIDRHVFYLEIANGWADQSSLVKWEKYDTPTSAYEKAGPRRDLAAKAFDTLCLNFFNMELYEKHSSDFNRRWEGILLFERLFSTIQKFFCVNVEVYSSYCIVKVRNLTHSKEENRSHSEKQVVAFLLNLAKYLWAWEGPNLSYDCVPNGPEKKKWITETYARVNATKPWMIEILSFLGKLDVLRNRMKPLDEACLAKLKEIALRSEIRSCYHPVEKNRLVKTLDEAYLVGSPAASLLK